MMFLDNLWSLSLDAAPWLLFGLVAAGIIKSFTATALIEKHFSDGGVWSIVKAAIVGAPLPLCSCGVLPAAIGLRRAGASKGATVSFLVATPETGVDSIALSWVMLGPYLMVVRPIAAILSAVVAGLLAQLVPDEASVKARSEVGESCCESEASCVSGVGDCCGDNTAGQVNPLTGRVLSGCWYALSDLLDDIALWLVVGLILAAAVVTFIEPGAIVEVANFWGGVPAMVLMILVGVPMYICATASTPVAAAMLIAGVSPGTVLVFLLAGPATNIATLGLVRKEMGGWVLAAYLAGISVSAIGFGLVTDWFARWAGIDVVGQIAEQAEVIPVWLAVGSLVVLVVFGVRPVRRMFVGGGQKKPSF